MDCTSTWNTETHVLCNSAGVNSKQKVLATKVRAISYHLSSRVLIAGIVGLKTRGHTELVHMAIAAHHAAGSGYELEIIVENSHGYTAEHRLCDATMFKRPVGDMMVSMCQTLPPRDSRALESI